MAQIVKDLGTASAYGYALDGGYTGTEEEFTELMASYATVAEEAAESAEDAEESALKSEGHAVGQQDGTDVDSESPYYHNNAKYYAEQASGSATTASTKAGEASGSATSAGSNALKAEGFAVGEQDGTDVDSESPYYHNNTKYYAEQASGSAMTANEKAGDASASAVLAGNQALKAEGFAVGEQGGTAVTSGSPYYHNNAEYFAGQASGSATAASDSAGAASGSATGAGASALKAEGFAVGEQNGTPVTSGSDYYQNNAEYYAGQAGSSASDASGSASAAEADALKAEGFAVGEQDGTDVGSDSPYYHNNAEYHAGQASGSATAALCSQHTAERYAKGTEDGTAVESGVGYHDNASYYAEQASGSATSANTDALKAEGFAVGQQGGTDVTSGSPYYENNAAYYAGQAEDAADHCDDVLESIPQDYSTLSTDVSSLKSAIADSDTVTASENHAIGDVFICGNQLLRATSVIIAGETVAVGTNAEVVNIASLIQEAVTNTMAAVADVADDLEEADERLTHGKAPVIVQEISTPAGVMALTDGADGMTVRGLLVSIDAMQPGTGDPSSENIRPISGWTGANISRIGKNLFNKSDVTVGYYLKSDGQLVKSSTGKDASGYIRIKGGSKIILSGTIAGGQLYIHFYDSNKTRIRGVSQDSSYKELTAPINAAFIRINVDNNYLNVTMLRLGSAVAGYEPFYGYQSIVADWETIAGTVWGGTYDPLSGVLTVTHGQIASYDGETLPGEWISDRDVYEEETTPTTGAQVVYELAEPVTYQLTPADPFTMLHGYNNIFADCGNINSIKYPADTKLYIDNSLAAANE